MDASHGCQTGQRYVIVIFQVTECKPFHREKPLVSIITQDGGNSRFEIPIPVLDEAMPVIADTTAMGDPLEIEYTLTFYEDSIGNKGAIPQEAAKKVLWIALGVIVIGGLLNHILKKRNSR